MAWDGMSDRRRHKRVDLRLLLEFDDPDSPDGSRKTRMETLNFSAGGFYCRFSRQVSPLTRLALSFVFPPFGPVHESERVIDCQAVVVRCQPEENQRGMYRVAACFTDLAPEDRAYIEEYLDWYEVVYAPQPDEDAPAGEEEVA